MGEGGYKLEERRGCGMGNIELTKLFHRKIIFRELKIQKTVISLEHS
jgi:hypothetical protein